MSVFGSKNMGLSDSLIDAVKQVSQSGKSIDTNIDVYNGLAEKMSSKEKMAKGLYNAKDMDKVDPKELKGKLADRKDKDIDNDGDQDKSDEYLHHKLGNVAKRTDEEFSIREWQKKFYGDKRNLKWG